MTENAVLPLLFDGLDYIYARVRDRLAGITTAEYLWEPVADCWSVRHDGRRWRADWSNPAPDPAPVTTIAWRLWHLGAACFAQYSESLGERPLELKGRNWYGEPEPALAAFQTAYDVFRERVTALGEDGVWRPLGPDWGPFAESSWAALVVHAQDELAHHGAEVALLRDLYLRQA